MSWIGDRIYQPLIRANAADVRPLHDFVLVRPHPANDLIINPGVVMTKGGVWRQPREKGVRTGDVVAIGPGDKIVSAVCPDCCTSVNRLIRENQQKLGKCKCGGALVTMLETPGSEFCSVDRAEMHVKPGDKVAYPPVPANEILIGDEKFVLLHCEQHILAVLEEAA